MDTLAITSGGLIVFGLLDLFFIYDRNITSFMLCSCLSNFMHACINCEPLHIRTENKIKIIIRLLCITFYIIVGVWRMISIKSLVDYSHTAESEIIISIFYIPTLIIILVNSYLDYICEELI